MKWSLVLIGLLFCLSTNAQNKVSILSPSEEEINNYSALGSIIAKKLLVNLKSELLKGIKEGGPINSLKICNIKAIPLTTELIGSSNNIVSIKRTSNKYRNPVNKPDELSQEALKFFEEKWSKPPDSYVQKYTLQDSTFYNYYQPLKIGGLCTTCHGMKEKMDQEVVKVLEKLYPEDKATGYKVGDFRGLIQVTFIEN